MRLIPTFFRASWPCLFGLVCLFLPTARAVAHPEGFSGLRVTISEDRIRAELTLHTRDLGAWFPPGKYPDYVADVTREMQKTVDEIIELQIDERPLVVDAVKAFLLEVGLIEIQVEYVLPQTTSQVELLIWSKHLIYLPRGHQQLLFIFDRRDNASDTAEGLLRLEDVLTIERDAGALLLPPASLQIPPVDTSSQALATLDSEATRKPRSRPAIGQPASRISFYLFGIEHILSGYDHLLFLAALLLACTTFREAATIITCFTIAHSLTLALAALDMVRLSSSIVEPAIAISIVYVGLENLCGTPVLRRRVAITCFFGLIHGLGFASALRDIGLGTLPGGVLLPLLKFNLGVESGQLFVAAILFPLLTLSRQTEQRRVILVRTGSVIVVIFGTFWFATRVATQLVSF